MEHDLVSLHWPVDLAGEDDVGRVAKSSNPVEQNSGGDCPGKCDAGGDRQDCGAHRRALRQVERQTGCLHKGTA